MQNVKVMQANEVNAVQSPTKQDVFFMNVRPSHSSPIRQASIGLSPPALPVVYCVAGARHAALLHHWQPITRQEKKVRRNKYYGGPQGNPSVHTARFYLISNPVFTIHSLATLLCHPSAGPCTYPNWSSGTPHSRAALICSVNTWLTTKNGITVGFLVPLSSLGFIRRRRLH